MAGGFCRFSHQIKTKFLNVLNHGNFYIPIKVCDFKSAVCLY